VIIKIQINKLNGLPSRGFHRIAIEKSLTGTRRENPKKSLRLF